MASHVLTSGIVALQREHPKIVVEVITDNRSLSLARREADVAVRLGRFEARETVVRKIGEMAFAPYAAQVYLDRHGPPDWSAGAVGHRIVRVQDDLLDTPDGRWFSERAGQAETAMLANSREVQLSAVTAGAGIGHLPCYLAAGHPDLVRPDAGAIVLREIWMGVHRDTRHAPRIKAAQEAIVGAVGRSRPILDPFGTARPQRT